MFFCFSSFALSSLTSVGVLGVDEDGWIGTLSMWLLIKVTFEDGRLRVGAEVDSLNRSVKVGVGDQVREIRSGESYTFDL
jgi:hypothetical protein